MKAGTSSPAGAVALGGRRAVLAADGSIVMASGTRGRRRGDADAVAPRDGQPRGAPSPFSHAV